MNRLGPEFQVLDDDGHHNGRNPYTSAGAMYLIAKPNDQKISKPIGEFNKARIVAKSNHIEHWLNGVKVLKMEVGSEAWNEQQAKTKFKQADGFGKGAGNLLLQDHGNQVWYKNIRIKSI